MRTRRRALATGAGLALLVACSGRDYEVLPPPPTTIALPTTTTSPDLSKVALRAVSGKKPSVVPVTPGDATINGVVNGPNGAVGGAVVHIERLVGDAVGSLDVLANPDGTFAVPGVIGGRYRVRAFKPAPDNLALVKPDVFFLAAKETHQSTLNLEVFAGLNATAAVAPVPPVVGDPTNVVVQVTERSVDDKGIVRAVPAPDIPVELFATGQWRVQGQNSQRTDDGGRAQWQVQCGGTGQQPLSVVVADNQSFSVFNGTCSEAPPSTTTEPSSTSTSLSTSSSTTSTTTARRTTTTT